MNDKQKHIAGLILQAMRETQDDMQSNDDLSVASAESELVQRLAEAYSALINSSCAGRTS